jgi:hypothetical protein
LHPKDGSAPQVLDNLSHQKLKKYLSQGPFYVAAEAAVAVAVETK